MGNKKAGYVTDESGNRVQGQNMGDCWLEPINDPRGEAFDKSRRRDYEAEFIRHAQSIADMTNHTLDRVAVIRDYRRQLQERGGGL